MFPFFKTVIQLELIWVCVSCFWGETSYHCSLLSYEMTQKRGDRERRGPGGTPAFRGQVEEEITFQEHPVNNWAMFFPKVQNHKR